MIIGLNYVFFANFQPLISHKYFTGVIDQNTNQKLRSYIAIDDISFSPQCSPPNVMPTGIVPIVNITTNHCDDPNTIPCNPKVNGSPCIKKTQICDSVTDCPGNEDEMHCGMLCSFDKKDMCGWTNVGRGKQQWSIQPASRFSSSSSNIPTTDSKGDKTGSFLIIDTSTGSFFILIEN